MSLSHPQPPHGMRQDMSNDVNVDMPDEVTRVVTAKNLVASPESAPTPNLLSPDASNPPSHSGVGVIGAGSLSTVDKAKRPHVPPPPRPGEKLTPPASALAVPRPTPSGPEATVPRPSPLTSAGAVPRSSPLGSGTTVPRPAASVSAVPKTLSGPKAFGKIDLPQTDSAESTKKGVQPSTSTRTTASPGSGATAEVRSPAAPAAERFQSSRRASALAARVDEALQKPSSPPSERTQIFRPNLSDPRLRRSAVPTAPPAADAMIDEISIPKAPAVPADIAAASQRRPGPHFAESRMREEQDQTRTYSTEVVDKLLHGETPTVKPQMSAADDVTRVGEIPIEELLRAQGKQPNVGVGYEDVTRVYDLPAGDARSEATSPRRFLPGAEPLVVVRSDPPKARWGWLVAFGLLVAATATGWAYRAPLGVQIHKVQLRVARGIGSPNPGNSVRQVAPAPQVTISISVSPGDARLVLDGEPVTNPFTTHRRSDKQLHSLVAEAPGYASLQRSVQFERDLTVVLALAPLPPTDTPVVAAKVSDKRLDNGTDKVRVSVAEPVPVVRAVKGHVNRTVPAATEPTANGNCSTPYAIDAAGIKTYKPECL